MPPPPPRQNVLQSVTVFIKHSSIRLFRKLNCTMSVFDPQTLNLDSYSTLHNMLNMCEYIKFLNEIKLIFLVLEDWGMLLVFTVMPIWAAIRGQWWTRCWLEAEVRATGDPRRDISHLHILSPGPPRMGDQYSTPSTLHSGEQSQTKCTSAMVETLGETGPKVLSSCCR